MKSLNTHQKNPYSKIYPEWATRAMDEVLKTPSGPARWRKAAAIWLNLNPPNDNGLRAKDEYRIVKAIVAEKRMDLKTKFGEINPSKAGVVSSGDSLREQLEMPRGMYMMIEMFDKTAFDGKVNPAAKANLNKLRKEFREFSVAESF